MPEIAAAGGVEFVASDEAEKSRKKGLLFCPAARIMRHEQTRAAFFGKQIFKLRYGETGKIAHIDTMHFVHLPFVACLAGFGKAFFVYSIANTFAIERHALTALDLRDTGLAWSERGLAMLALVCF